MQLSKYSLFVENYPNSGEYLVYHTRTQALLKIDQRLKDSIDGIASGASDERFEALHRMGILVRDEAEDQDRLDRFMEQKKLGISDRIFVATILTTYNCNFACTYCFEESTRTSSQKLNLPTSDLVIQWLQKKVSRLGVKQLELNYYGGEPLMNQTAMEHITVRMKSWCEEKGVAFRMAIQTNGALLTPEFLDKYLPLGLTRVQVSLDGTREVHDRQRPMRGTGTGTFDLVIKNLLAAAGRVKLVIASGYDNGDPQGVLDLLDYLDEIGLLKKLTRFKYAPIHPTLGPKDHPENIVSPGCMSNYATDTLIRTENTIKEAMRKKGMSVGSGLTTSMCPVTTGDNGVTIDTNGLIFKCNAMLGHPDLAVGDVRQDGYNERAANFKTAEPWKQCDSDCPYVPLCNTGCRLFSFFKTGDFLAKSCERSYMDAFVQKAIKAEYENQITAKASQPVPVFQT